MEYGPMGYRLATMITVLSGWLILAIGIGHGTEVASTSVPSLSPSWQAIVVSDDAADSAGEAAAERADNAPLTQFNLELQAGEEELSLLSLLLDCACLRYRDPLPLRIPAHESAVLTIDVVLMLPGAKTIQAITNRGTLRTRIDLAGDVHARSGRAILQAAWDAVPAEGSLTLVLHNLRAGNPADCNCAPEGLGGRPRLVALSNWLSQHATMSERDLPLRWLSGSVSRGSDSIAGELIHLGWQRPSNDELVVSPRPLVTLRSSPSALAIASPDAGPQPNHARLITPLLSDGTGVEAIIRRPDGSVISSVTVPVDDSFQAALATQSADR